MTPEDINERHERKEKMLLGAESLAVFVRLNCWHAARETLTQLDSHIRQIELIELQEKQESQRGS